MSKHLKNKQTIPRRRSIPDTKGNNLCGSDNSLIEFLNEDLIVKPPKANSLNRRASDTLQCSVPPKKHGDEIDREPSKIKSIPFFGGEGQTRRRRHVHNPKMQTELIDFLESSDINLLERIPLEGGSGEPSIDKLVKRMSEFEELKKSAVMTITDISPAKRKKMPSNLCDIKAVIAALKDSPGFTFYYLVWAVPLWSEFYTPYCLKLVPYELVDKSNFLTISTKGVTHHLEGNMMFTPLDEWERDYDIYCKLMKIKTFSHFIMWKSFYVWHKNMAWHKVMVARESLKKALLYLNPILGRALLDVMELCWKISKISFVDLSVTEKNILLDFCNNQLLLKGKLEVRLLEFRELVKEIVNTACHGALLVVGYTPDDANLRVPDHIVGTIAMRGIKTSRDGKYRMTYGDQALKKKTCVRLASFIQLVDFLVQTVFHNMVRTTLTEVVNVLTIHMQHLPSELLVKSADLSMVLEEPRSNPPRFPLFVVDLIVDIHDLKLNPSCAEFLEAFQTLMTDFESVVLNIPVFLSDVFFDPFTEPMVCGKQEERLCGLGPSLEYVIKEDKEIQDMKLKVIKSFLDNFKCVHLFIEHFKNIHNFYIQDKLLDTAVITEETDDVKLFKEVCSEEDLQLLQCSLRQLSQWCEVNKMDINPSKSKHITFHRTRSPVVAEIYMDGVLVERGERVRDLGVLLDSSMDFADHIDGVCLRASRTMGFIFRLSKLGLNFQTMVILYKALVRPLLEYASPVWSPYLMGQVDKLQSIQRRFIRILGVRNGYSYRDVPIMDIENNLGLLPLSSRRHVADLLILYKLVNGDIDCPQLLQLINFRVPSVTRLRQLFELKQSSTNYLLHSPIPRMLRAGNGVCNLVDFFSDSKARFRRTILTYCADMNAV